MLRTFDYELPNGRIAMCIFRILGMGRFELEEIVERPLGRSILAEISYTLDYERIMRKAEIELWEDPSLSDLKYEA